VRATGRVLLPNSRSFSGYAVVYNATPNPSPLLMRGVVGVNGKMRPKPPVKRITALA